MNPSETIVSDSVFTQPTATTVPHDTHNRGLSLMWLGQKTRASAFPSNKNRPGRTPEHIEALAMNTEFVPTPKTAATEPVDEFAPGAFAPEPA